MAATRRAGEGYVYPLPEFQSLPPLPPVRTVDADKYMGTYTKKRYWKKKVNNSQRFVFLCFAAR